MSCRLAFPVHTPSGKLEIGMQSPRREVRTKYMDLGVLPTWVVEVKKIT